ncbi:unknown similar to AMEV017 [Adoxophyes honmai entomopoxvirus 'L']|uniref:Uncharacterized protein n=1 Tax=Adoxophyes honmai entomopoxvirus 'L' TaxID=1293540 RepID=A0A916KNV9_9POXV|nr:unknown similar to AMEV017 [Adoxophyes honmai entomopoxvirus 'L']CCU55346.1 unknown similar to AMEV017 [Adoxophyes honmai entomopoxvirus 'L']
MQSVKNIDDYIHGAKSDISLTDRKKKIGKMIKTLISNNNTLNKQISDNNNMLNDLLNALKKYDCCL